MLDLYSMAKELPEVLRLNLNRKVKIAFKFTSWSYAVLLLILTVANWTKYSKIVAPIIAFCCILIFIFMISVAFTIKGHNKSYRERKLKAYLNYHNAYYPSVIEELIDAVDYEYKENSKKTSYIPYISMIMGIFAFIVPFVVIEKLSLLNKINMIISMLMLLAICTLLICYKKEEQGALSDFYKRIIDLLKAQKLAAAGEIEEAENVEEFYRTIGDFGFATATVERLNKLWDKEIEHEPRSKRRKHNRYKKRFIRENENDGAVTFIAYHKESPIGQATLILSPKSKQVKGLPKCVCNKTVANFAALRIDEEFRGKGLSSVLFDMAEKYARFTEGKSAVTVGVEKDNLRAREIYAHWGFDTLVHITGEEEILYLKKSLNNKAKE